MPNLLMKPLKVPDLEDYKEEMLDPEREGAEEQVVDAMADLLANYQFGNIRVRRVEGLPEQLISIQPT